MLCVLCFHIKAYKNGVVDFTDGKLRPFSSDIMLFTYMICLDPDARCDVWLQFLKTVLPEKESPSDITDVLGFVYDG